MKPQNITLAVKVKTDYISWQAGGFETGYTGATFIYTLFRVLATSLIQLSYLPKVSMANYLA